MRAYNIANILHLIVYTLFSVQVSRYINIYIHIGYIRPTLGGGLQRRSRVSIFMTLRPCIDGLWLLNGAVGGRRQRRIFSVTMMAGRARCQSSSCVVALWIIKKEYIHFLMYSIYARVYTYRAIMQCTSFIFLYRTCMAFLKGFTVFKEYIKWVILMYINTKQFNGI